MGVRRPIIVASIALTTAVLGVAGPAVAGLPRELPIYNVVGTGVNADQAAALGRALGVKAAFADGSVRHVSPSFGGVPMRPSERGGLDEGGNRTRKSFFDLEAISRIKPMSAEAVREAARNAFADAKISLPDGATAQVGNTQLTLKPRRGQARTVSIDTFIRYRFQLGEFPLIGPGAKAGITFGPDGSATELELATYELEQGENVLLLPAADAKAECLARYPRGSRVSLGIVYVAPALDAGVKEIFPSYLCKGTAPGGAVLVQALLPAVQKASPRVRLRTALSADGRTVDANLSITGGRRPYRVQWTDSAGALGGVVRGRSLTLRLRPDGRSRSELISAIVTDANGMTTSAQATIAMPRVRTGVTRPATSPGSLATTDVGGEFNVYEWDCVKQSSAGFQSEFAGRGIPVAFRWNAPNAWERDFRDTATKSGGDASYVDNVDLAWYTGHGNPGGFSFDNGAHDDAWIVPNDARWGDRDLEWLQLESCNVLQFDDGSGNLVWSRWSNRFDGLHLLNGFQTTASCVTVSGGTAGRFASWLLGRPFGFVTFPPMRVRQAWALMALDLEPSGRQYVTMGVYGAGGITNYDDFFWGKGPVGPDIPKSQITGYWWLMGQV